MSSQKSFYVTTPIYYATAKPHLGSLYSTVLADVFARIALLEGKDVFFLTGTDEHGQKIASAALAAGKQPKEFVDGFIPAFKDAWNMYHIEYSRFMRTTDQDHGINVQKLITQLIDQGDIYKGSYTGWYCTPCETFLTEKESETSNNTSPLCPSCNRPTVSIKESTYFFRLSSYETQLLNFYKDNPHFIMPKERAQEIISFVKAGLKDLSISRTAVKWGVPFPGDHEHTLYVWIEALCNYITAIGYGQEDQKNSFAHWWPADVHIMAKDIIRFHAIFWPALLIAAKLQLPKQLLVHGWIKINDQKMSKSLGNAIDPVVLAQTYHPECIRYFMIRYLPVNQDAEFSIPALEQAITADLANDLGNLAHRMILLAEKYNHVKIDRIQNWSSASITLKQQANEMVNEFIAHVKDFQLHLAYAKVWQFINCANSFFHAQEPWKAAKTDKNTFNEIISATAHALHAIGTLCWPVMPEKMDLLCASIGHSFDTQTNQLAALIHNEWDKSFILSTKDTLFIKPVLLEESSAKTEPQALPKDENATALSTEISVDLFKKCELRAGTVLACQTIPKADKLLSLTVSFGEHGERTILSGIKKWYAPEQLIGKQFIFLYNLAPRSMLGTASHGMILCAPNADGIPTPIKTIDDVPNGSLLG